MRLTFAPALSHGKAGSAAAATLLAAFLALITQRNGSAQGYEPLAVTNPPAVDGRLDEAAWSHAPAVADFLQRLPREGAEPTERTEVRLLYTRDALYIGFRAFDRKPDGIRATVMKRDDSSVVTNDQFAVAIDSHNDGSSGFWFSTNPLGVRVDAQFFDEGDLWESNWNGIWECRTTVDSTGWTAEIEIPFSTLRFRQGEETVMGINLFRRHIRTNESLFAPLIPLSYSNGTPNVSIARKYRFHGIRSGHEVELKPYALTGVENESGAGGGWEGKAGLDLRYPLTSSFTSYFSLNTDFAEAEADELQVNLTRFPLFIPEKRDFFLENAGDFSFGLPQNTELFFSRRIGLSEDDVPVPVLFGARAAGKLSSLDVGLMNVQTRSDAGSPAENFSAARVRAAIAPRSYVGAAYTGRYSGGTMLSSWGADLLWYFSHNISFTGFASAVSGGGGRSSYYAALQRGGEATSFLFSYLDVGRSFDPAVGFVRRTDVRTWTGSFAYPRYWNAHGIRNISPGIQADLTRDHGGLLLDSTQKAWVDLVLASEDQFTVYWKHNEEFVPEAFPVFRDVDVAPGRYFQDRGGVTLATKEGRPFSVQLAVSTGGFYGGSLREAAPSIVYRLNRNIQLTQVLSANFVDLGEDKFHLLLSRTRIDWSLNTKLSASALVQYDNNLQQTAVNLRLTYLFHEGTQLFVVYDHGDDDAAVPNSQARLLVKFTYLF